VVCNERDLDDDDHALAQEVADRAGQALENARLHEAALSAGRARSDFLALVSHELRTPLNAILGYTQLLHDGMIDDADARGDMLQRIESSALQLLRIIEEILVFASLEAERLEPAIEEVRLDELIDDVADVAEPIARERELRFDVHVRQPDALIRTDAAKLRRILLDLLTNAVKFTPSGSVSLTAGLAEDALVVEVGDTGVGIPAEHVGRIFEPFWQTEEPLTRRRGGTGLGLTVSRRLARLLGGDIAVASEPGAGSTFTLRVPVSGR
jgi:signal transduction histidine kinase